MILTGTDIKTITTYPVMESFYTIQGEGTFTGHAAYFIRLGGCDVGCVWCDVKDSWNAENHPQISAGDIISNLKKDSGAKPGQAKPIIVITGGEPLMHNLDALTGLLKKEGYTINIETSGSSPLSGQLDWICLSPKKFKAPLDEVVEVANELKVVVFNKSDFGWAERYAAKVPSSCKLFLQPEWDKRDQVTPLIVDFIKENPQWQLSLQTHKYINVP
jgi:organic radical activating enzyme